MSIKYQYLVDPLLGFQTKNGSLNTAGIINVYDAATDDPSVTYKDFVGTRNAQDIRLDDNGRAVIICDDSRAYRVEVRDQYGALLYTQSPMYAKGGGGGVMTNVTITSEDGTVDIDDSSEGGVKSFDLSVKHEDPEYVVTNSWYVRGDGSANHCGYIVPQGRTTGNMGVTSEGILLKGGTRYHVDAWIDVKADNDLSDPGNSYRTRDMLLNFRLMSANGTPVTMEFDNSFPHRETYNLSGDLHPLTDTYLKVYFDNYDWANYQSGDITQSHLEMPRLSVHSIVGTYCGGLDQVYHDGTLIGNGTQENELKVAPITISMLDPSLRSVIETQSDWTEEDPTSAAYIQHRPDLTQYATQSDLASKQDVLSAGEGIVIDENNEISVDTTVIATQADLAEKEDVISDLSDIRAGAALGATAVQDPDYVHTDNNFTDADSAKLSGIEAGAEVNVQSDWAESDSTSDSFIQNKPTIPSGSQLVPAATSSDAGEVLTVDQNGVPEWAPAQAPISAGDGIDITNNVVSAKVDGTSVTINANGELEATAAPQVQSDWAEIDPADVSFILNKPDQINLVAGENITLVDDAQNNTVTISAASVNAPVSDVTVDSVSVVNAQGVAEIPSIPVIGTITL